MSDYLESDFNLVAPENRKKLTSYIITPTLIILIFIYSIKFISVLRRMTMDPREILNKKLIGLCNRVWPTCIVNYSLGGAEPTEPNKCWNQPARKWARCKYMYMCAWNVFQVRNVVQLMCMLPSITQTIGHGWIIGTPGMGPMCARCTDTVYIYV